MNSKKVTPDNATKTPKIFKIEVGGGFRVALPLFEIYDKYGVVLPLDYTCKTIFLALLLNPFVEDSYLESFSKSYPSVICRLRKIITNVYGHKIARVRRCGYQLIWRDTPNERRTS